jgi:hypothetical protein
MQDMLAANAAAIFKSRTELDKLRCEVQEIMARGRDTIFQSRELIARANLLPALTSS